MGRNLQLRKVALGINRAQLAQALGIPPRLLYDYEKGAAPMDDKLLVTLARHLLVDASFYYEDPDIVSVSSKQNRSI